MYSIVEVTKRRRAEVRLTLGREERVERIHTRTPTQGWELETLCKTTLDAAFETQRRRGEAQAACREPRSRALHHHGIAGRPLRQSTSEQVANEALGHPAHDQEAIGDIGGAGA